MTLVALTRSTTASAIELYSFFKKDCRYTSGAVLYVDETSVTVLTLKGSQKKLAIDNIELVARYDALENPYARINPDASESFLFQVSVESDRKSFKAYATNFFENLVLFFDLSGKMRVIELDEIMALRSAPKKEVATYAPKVFRPIKLLPPPERSGCQALESFANNSSEKPIELVSTYVISDKLRLDSFFTRYRDGYRRLNSLTERTMFYGRPILFDQKTRLGFVYEKSEHLKKLKLNPFGWDNLPIYLDLGGGSPYGFQTHAAIGYKPLDSVPIVRSISGITSQFKSHLIHGILVGNLNGLAAGNALYSNGGAWNDDPSKHRESLWGQNSFNHMTLLGGDYGPWSVSFGSYFPVFAFGQKNELREVVSSTSSFVLHVGYLGSDWLTEGFFYNTKIRGTCDDKMSDNDSVSVSNQTIKYMSLRFVPQKVALASQSLRFNFTYSLKRELSATTGLFFSTTKYREDALRRNTALGYFGGSSVSVTPSAEEPSNSGTNNLAETEQLVTNSVDFTDLGSRLMFHLDLGQWVALRAEAIYEIATFKGGFQENVGDSKRSANDQYFTYLGTMELLL